MIRQTAWFPKCMAACVCAAKTKKQSFASNWLPAANLTAPARQREEYEVCAEDIRAGIRQLPSVGAPQDFCDQLMQSNLIEQGRTMFTRFASQLAYKGCTCELSFDYGRMTHLTRIGTICEMELEYKGGSAFDFDELAITLQNKFALEPQPLSKLARMMQL